MPRIGRKNLKTAFFHVIVQGINREYIFYKEEYMEKYKRLIIDNLKKYNIKLIAYCIMNNHAHTLIYTENIEEMSKYMKSINISYARYYNRKENRVGFVFRNRFESEPIYEETYLLNCIRYIHDNPVKANIVDSVEKYKYSSHNDYIYKKGIVSKDIIQLVFGDNKNYIEEYNLIHNINHEFKDFISDIDCKQKYKYLTQTDIKDINSDVRKIKRILNEMIFKDKLKINEASDILGISRFKISRILKNTNY